MCTRSQRVPPSSCWRSGLCSRRLSWETTPAIVRVESQSVNRVFVYFFDALSIPPLCRQYHATSPISLEPIFQEKWNFGVFTRFLGLVSALELHRYLILLPKSFWFRICCSDHWFSPIDYESFDRTSAQAIVQTENSFCLQTFLWFGKICDFYPETTLKIKCFFFKTITVLNISCFHLHWFLHISKVIEIFLLIFQTWSKLF